MWLNIPVILGTYTIGIILEFPPWHLGHKIRGQLPEENLERPHPSGNQWKTTGRQFVGVFFSKAANRWKNTLSETAPNHLRWKSLQNLWLFCSSGRWSIIYLWVTRSSWFSSIRDISLEAFPKKLPENIRKQRELWLKRVQKNDTNNEQIPVQKCQEDNFCVNLMSILRGNRSDVFDPLNELGLFIQTCSLQICASNLLDRSEWKPCIHTDQTIYIQFPHTGRYPEMIQSGWPPLIFKTLEHRKVLFALPSFPETLKSRHDFSETTSGWNRYR